MPVVVSGLSVLVDKVDSSSLFAPCDNEGQKVFPEIQVDCSYQGLLGDGVCRRQAFQCFIYIYFLSIFLSHVAIPKAVCQQHCQAHHSFFGLLEFTA